MPGSSSPVVASHSDEAKALFKCLHLMGKQQTNAVLEILDGVTQIEQNKKYPAKNLHFGGTHWRAYYHCHAVPEQQNAEHGHFHIFARTKDADHEPADWTHVAGLSVDNMGQPLRWFTVNQWVTGGSWYSAQNIITLLDDLPSESDISLAECWLVNLMALYRKEIQQLLKQRDVVLTQIKVTRSNSDIFQDRNIYELAQQPLNLLEKLEHNL